MEPASESETPLSDAELALHLAGGTLAAWQHAGRGQPGEGELFGGAPDGWERARLAAASQSRRAARRGGQGLTPGQEAHPAGVAARLEALERPGELARHRDRLRTHGVRLVPWRAADYPKDLLELPQPPLALGVLGRWPPPRLSAAVVGSRAATAYGLRIARRAGQSAAGADVGVVSGLARGIDRAALEGCRQAGGWPVAVLGCGLDIAYPRGHQTLQQQIGEAGTLVSEFALGQRPDRWTFPRRNRVIAALAGLVLVVEAAERSGALITVDHAADLGREIVAVPGPIDAPLSVGCNRLLADGATPLLDPDHLPALVRGEPAGERPAAPPDDPLLAGLGGGAWDVDALAEQLGWPPPKTRSRLIALELAGRVKRGPGGRWERR